MKHIIITFLLIVMAAHLVTPVSQFTLGNNNLTLDGTEVEQFSLGNNNLTLGESGGSVSVNLSLTLVPDSFIVIPTEPNATEVIPQDQTNTTGIFNVSNNDVLNATFQLKLTDVTNKTRIMWVEQFNRQNWDWIVNTSTVSNSTYNETKFCMSFVPVNWSTGTYGRLHYNMNNTETRQLINQTNTSLTYNQTFNWNCPQVNNVTINLNVSDATGLSFEWEGNESSTSWAMLVDGVECYNSLADQDNLIANNCSSISSISDTITISVNSTTEGYLYFDNIYSYSTFNFLDYVNITANLVNNYSTGNKLSETYVSVGNVSTGNWSYVWLWYDFGNLPSGLSYDFDYQGVSN